MLQDHLGSTSVSVSDTGVTAGTIRYFPFGDYRNGTGTILTDKKFTGQVLDQTGLYYYGARYYDAIIGRFISADTIVPNPMNPQSLKLYTYCLNNPLKYIDPSGHDDLNPDDPGEYVGYILMYAGNSTSGWERTGDGSIVQTWMLGGNNVWPSTKVTYSNPSWRTKEGLTMEEYIANQKANWAIEGAFMYVSFAYLGEAALGIFDSFFGRAAVTTTTSVTTLPMKLSVRDELLKMQLILN